MRGIGRTALASPRAAPDAVFECPHWESSENNRERRVDPTAKQAQQSDPVAARPEGGDADSKHWSPWSTRTARWSWGLMAIFSAIYFVVAILTSAEFAELACPCPPVFTASTGHRLLPARANEPRWTRFLISNITTVY